MTLPDDLYHLAAHLADDHDGLPVGSKNTVLLAAKAIEASYHIIDGYRERVDELEAVVGKLREGAAAGLPLAAKNDNAEAVSLATWVIDTIDTAIRIAELEAARCDMLRSVVDKLPKTADGVIVVPERDFVWFPIGGLGPPLKLVVRWHSGMRGWVGLGGAACPFVESCYSSEEAASHATGSKA